MDTPRWLVLISVFFCMTTVLTLMHRSEIASLQKKSELTQNEISSPKNFPITQTKGEETFDSTSNEIFNNQTNSYAKPPRQIFEMDTSNTIDEEKRAIEKEGKILD